MNEVVVEARSLHQDEFGNNGCLTSVFAPGRGEFMGVWADVYGGPMVTFCLPMGIAIVVSWREDHKIVCVSDCYKDERIEFDLTDIGIDIGWAHYLRHVLDTFSEDGYCLSTGLNIAIASDLPVGAGLSSSSALTTGFVIVLNKIMELGLDSIQIADVACRSEWKVTKGGNKDQMTIALAQEGSLFYMRSFMLPDGSNYDYDRGTEVKHIAWPSDYSLAVVDTGTRRIMADCEGYIRAKERAMSAFGKINKWREQEDSCCFRYPADVTVEYLDQARTLNVVSEAEYLALMHPVTDKVRTESFLDGPLNVSHFTRLIAAQQSLRGYGIGSSEFDRGVQVALFHGAIGACQIGAGYAGCLVAVIKKEAESDFVAKVRRAYSYDSPLANVYICTPCQGARLVP